MNILTKWFHRHTYDGDSWKLIDAVELVDSTPRYTYVVGDQPKPIIIGKRYVYTNTCMDCGMLTEKIINS